MGNFKSTTEILNLVFSGETLNTVQSTAECFNAVYSADDNALKVNVIGGGGGGDGTSGTSGIDGATGEDGEAGTSGIDGEAGTSGTSGLDGSGGDLSAIEDAAILFNNGGSVSGTTNMIYDKDLHLLTALTPALVNAAGGDSIMWGTDLSVSSFCNAAFGRGSTINSYDNIIAGSNNTSNGYQNATFGDTNTNSGSRCLMYGRQSNNAGGFYSIVGGYKCYNNGSFAIVTGSEAKNNSVNGFASGTKNENLLGTGSHCFNYGAYNIIYGHQSATAIGRKLSGGTNDDMFVVGYGNDAVESTDYLEDVIFQVGCGSGSTTASVDPDIRQNGLTVHRNMNAEFGGDIDIAGDPIITDTVTGTKYRIQVTSGVLGVVAI